MTETLIEKMVARWSAPTARPLFRGRLIDDDGCCCAQGDVLRVCGVSDDSLRNLDQAHADRRVADELGISLAHSILLRQVNDSEKGCPQDVLAHPERVLGPEAPRILAFWRHLDTLTQEQWEAAEDAAEDAAWDAAEEAAWPASKAAAWEAAEDAAKAAAWAAAKAAAKAAAWAAAKAAVWAAAKAASKAAAWAAADGAVGSTNEIQGASELEKFYFLPLFGIDDPTKLAPIPAR